MDNMNKVMVEMNIPGMTSKVYDQVWQDLRAAGYENPKGLIHHVGAPADKGWKVVDVWENADKFNEFGQTLMPILDKNGIQGVQPVILPLHYEYSGIEKPIM